MCIWWMEDLIPWLGKGRAKERTEWRLMIRVGEGDRSVQIVELVPVFLQNFFQAFFSQLLKLRINCEDLSSVSVFCLFFFFVRQTARSFVFPFGGSFARSVGDLLVRSFIHSFIHSFVRSFVLY